MERLALEEIERWHKDRRKPLMVYGARQVGKTYLVKDIFAERHYHGHYIYVDFKKDSAMRDFINLSNVCDAGKIIEYLSLRERREIDGSTLLIFDEIQEALPIITAMKYFKQDHPEIPVICTGSMVRIKLKRKAKNDKRHNTESFFFPVGCVDTVMVYPLSFEEFLLNVNPRMRKAILNSCKAMKPLDPPIHKMALDLFYRYLLIGGMPENVQLFLDGKSLLQIRQNAISLFDDYLNDMELYQASGESIIRAKSIFGSIYAQLSKESKDFKASLVDSSLRSRDLNSPLEWLETASLVYRSRQIKEQVSIPLKEGDENNYRIYLLDLGFLAYQSDIDLTTFVTSEAKNTLSGVFFENYVANELKAYGFPLFYWKGKGGSEFEFLLESEGKIIPIDVKKRAGSLRSLAKYKERNCCQMAVKISMNHLGYDKETKILAIPLYMVFAWLSELRKAKADSFSI
jgi:uncharacterized protein